MNGAKKFMVLLLSMALLLTMLGAIPTVAESDVSESVSMPEPEPEPEVTPEPAAEPTSEPATDPTPEPVAEPTSEPAAEPELSDVPEVVPEEVPFEATVRIKLENEGDIYYGDQVTLRAEVEANAEYVVTWECYNVDAEPDEYPWVLIGLYDTYTFDVTEANAALMFRAVVNDLIASDIYTLPSVQERPEEVRPEEGEQPVPEQEPVTALNPDREILIHAEWEGDALHYGDESTLVAELIGYENAFYGVQWQTSKDEVEWTDVEGATQLTHTFTMTEENCQDYWRLIVNVTAVVAEEADAA